MQILLFIRRLLKEQPLRFVLVVASLSLAGILEGFGVAALVPLLELIASGKKVAVSPGTIGEIVAKIIALFNLSFNIVTVLTFILILVIAEQLVVLASQKLSLGSIFSFEANLRKKLYQNIFDAEWPFFFKEKAGRLVNALTVEASRAGNAYHYLILTLNIMSVIIVYLALALFISWQMALAVITVGLIVIFFLKKRVSVGTRFGQSITDTNTKLQIEASEHISGAKLVKGSASEPQTINRFQAHINFLAHEQYKSYMNQALIRVFYDSFSAVIILLGIYLAVTQLKISLAQLVVFLFIFYRLSPRLSNVQTHIHSLLTYLPALNQVDEVIERASKFREESGNKIINKLSKGIVFKDVCFSYDQGKLVLNKVSLKIPKGKIIAIVGPSGAGKTTLVDLLMGLIRPNSGSVLIDNIPLEMLNLREWRKKIGYVEQDAVFFNASVKENITWFYPDASQEEIEEATRFAYADEFIKKLPNGYNTVIGDRGIQLSGGQRQRLALARVVIKKPDLLVLDEATSALDAESEQKIQKAIEGLSGLITVIIVTHRLATVKNADYIYVLEGGKLVEKGTWSELISRKGRFYKLKQLQDLEMAEKKSVVLGDN